MPVLVKICQNKNQKMPSCYGKYYGKTVATTTMTYRELVKHMAEHNTVYGRDVCEGVATKLEDYVLTGKKHLWQHGRQEQAHHLQGLRRLGWHHLSRGEHQPGRTDGDHQIQVERLQGLL